MRSTVVVAAAAAGLLAALAAPPVSRAALPPNRNDPCAHAGRDSCGTTGAGFYETYRYGIRWFGDFRRAIPGAKRAFCLDLRFWYASPRYRYRRASVEGFRNKDGEPVPVERQQELAYAIWRFGRTQKPSRQVAVMLYVHSRMGDARPGEVDPHALDRPKIVANYEQVAAAAARYHGPYRIETRLPEHLAVGRQATATIRVVSGAGHALPNERLTLSATGASGVPAYVETDGAGLAQVALTPAAVAGLRLRVETGPLAASRPHVFVPTSAAARANGQRLAVPAAHDVTATVSRTDVAASPQISTRASTQTAAPGSTISDTVTVTGLGGATATVQVQLWGPFASRGAISCSGTPYWTGSFVAHGNGTTTTASVELKQAGYYAFRGSIAAGPSVPAFVAPCGAGAETTFAHARPSLATEVSDELVRPGARISDQIRVTGLGDTPATVAVELYGPFASRTAIRCTHAHLDWHGQVAVHGSGEVASPPVKIGRAGFYGFRERLLASPLVAGAATRCAQAAETSLAAPRIVTGRGSLAAFVSGRAKRSAAPVRVRIRRLGIDAPVSASEIDLAHGALGIPKNIHRTGWWRDGMAPGAKAGSILIAGHRDSAKAGTGVFFRLGRARAGDRIEVATDGGRTFGYRVASVRKYRKNALPLDVYARTGKPRLVLVTCGGPFDEATGHYRDDVVVTAMPVR